VRLGRADRKGAFRLAAFVFVTGFLTRALAGHHVAAFSEVTKFFEALAWTSFHGGLTGLVYLALEPYVRKLWPQALISWSRLLMGRFRDPAVGRDALLGITVGLLLNVVTVVTFHAPSWLGYAPSPPELGELSDLDGLRFTLSNFFRGAQNCVLFPLGGLFLVLLLRVLLRREGLAVAVLVGLLTLGPALLNEHGWILAPILAATFWLLITILVRLGLLAFVSCNFFWSTLWLHPVTFDLDAWWAGSGALALVVALAVLGWAFWTSLAGRPLVREGLLGE
jgi:hypothetical protein